MTSTRFHRRLAPLAAGGLCALAGCAPPEASTNTTLARGPAAEAPVAEAPAAEAPVAKAPVAPQQPLTDEARIEAGLARLDALEILDTGALFEAHTTHQWIPYGGFWNSVSVDLETPEAADRLEAFVARAEAAVADFDGPESLRAIASGDNRAEALCWSLEGDDAPDAAACLTIEPYEKDVAALNALEVVEVVGIVRDAPSQDGLCYSSWYTVTAADCLRAHQLRAIVEATRDLPSAQPPAGTPMSE